MAGMSLWVAATRRVEQAWQGFNELLQPEEYWRATDRVIVDQEKTFRMAYAYIPDGRQWQGNTYYAWQIIRDVESRLAAGGMFPGEWQPGHKSQSPNWEWMVLGATDRLDEIPYGMSIEDWIQITNSRLANDPYSIGVYGTRDDTYQPKPVPDPDADPSDLLPEDERLDEGYMFAWMVEFFKQYSAYGAKWPDPVNPGNGREVWPPGYHWRTIPPQALSAFESGNPQEGGPLG